MREVQVTDYVLATKYGDGDPMDPFAVGFYDGEKYEGRHFVVDRDGKQFRGGGFRRVKKITQRRGRFLVDNISKIETSSRSLWWWVRAPMTEDK